MRICQHPNITIILLHLCQVEREDSVFPIHEVSTDRGKWQTRTSIRLCLNGTGMDRICFGGLRRLGNTAEARFSRETPFGRRTQGRFSIKPPIDQILHSANLRNTFANETGTSEPVQYVQISSFPRLHICKYIF